ncbi:hypothetical protein [Arthrobacter sunyaminii]|uniref:Uncharacterized protein n=1 Tax=Arthrobacter sunyaminii TaxID=2816859 RepID=A0A975S8F5_9MICC|nr:hypothetical protein [Arthrobacter sunyaminii]MBO0906999.1 hypothetical protein [Arthrobacter sunyaminii]QWQ37742.1 hypothetical protein KG104_08590 [Arthrobacter sunyaminii]
MTDKKMSKSAGEHWVCSVLARHNWAAALTRDGLERTDILAVHTDGPRRQIEVQVKAIQAKDAKGTWLLGLKSQQPALSQHEWYVLVLLDTSMPTAAPRSFIVPRDHVAAAAWIGHMNWLTDPETPPGKRNAGPDQSRVSVETFQPYEDRWDLLGTPTGEIPVMLPRHYRKLAVDPRVGLPEDHPWKEYLPDW